MYKVQIVCVIYCSLFFLCCLQAAVKCASSPRTNALSTKPRLPLAALAADAARNHPPNNVNSHVSHLPKHSN